MMTYNIHVDRIYNGNMWTYGGNVGHTKTYEYMFGHKVEICGHMRFMRGYMWT